MVKRMKPEDLANQMLCVTARTKKRVLDLREYRDGHEQVLEKLLNFWDEGHKENEPNDGTETANQD